jgi:ion channel-forming bestrophin family protein
MYVGNRFSVRTVWFWAWRNLLQATAVSAAVYAGYEWLGWKFLSIPFLPVATIGTAVAFYVGFKNNNSYDRLWEGRRIWGSILNVSRAWAALVLGVVGRPLGERDPETVRAEVRRLIYRQIAWVNALRIQLRQRPAPHRRDPLDLLHISWVRHQGVEDGLPQDIAPMVHKFAPADESGVLTHSNVAAHLLREQADEIARLKREGWIDDFEHSDLMRHVTECYNQQGAAERIKSFPFPRQYAIFSGAFVKLFIFLIPFGLIREMAQLGRGASWLVIPFSVLIAWVFYTMEQVGDSSEDPFEGGGNDVPLSAICRNIEVDLREMLGETELPPRLQPVENVLL